MMMMMMCLVDEQSFHTSACAYLPGFDSIPEISAYLRRAHLPPVPAGDPEPHAFGQMSIRRAAVLRDNLAIPLLHRIFHATAGAADRAVLGG